MYKLDDSTVCIIQFANGRERVKMDKLFLFIFLLFSSTLICYNLSLEISWSTERINLDLLEVVMGQQE